MSSGFRVDTIQDGNGMFRDAKRCAQRRSLLGQKPKSGQRVSVHYTGRYGIVS